MRSTLGRVASCIAIMLAMTAILGCGRTEKQKSGKMLVAASIAPLADFAREVGGQKVNVELLVPAGASPHTYQLNPDQMSVLHNASVLVLNGIGLEYWADKAIDAANNPKLIIVHTADGLPTIDTPDDSDHKGGNPHVWLDPKMAIHQVEAIRDAYIKADPKNADYYRNNSKEYVAKLMALDADIRKQVHAFSHKKFIAFHPAWAYFAREYGLTQEAVIETSPGKEPSPAEIRTIVDKARTLKAKAIFAESQFSPKAAKVIADEVGAKVIILDPLGEPPSYNYIQTMHDNLNRMSEALK